MNQAILFNDDITFNKKENAWCLTAQTSGQRLTIYFHSLELKQLTVIDSNTMFDLEEIAENWLSNNDLDDNVIHITMR